MDSHSAKSTPRTPSPKTALDQDFKAMLDVLKWSFDNNEVKASTEAINLLEDSRVLTGKEQKKKREEALKVLKNTKKKIPGYLLTSVLGELELSHSRVVNSLVESYRRAKKEEISPKASELHQMLETGDFSGILTILKKDGVFAEPHVFAFLAQKK